MACVNRRSVNLIYLILLIALVYAFRTDLLVASVRLYTLVDENPNAERLLGDYYQNLARSSNELSTVFYDNAMKKYKEDLKTAKPNEQVVIKAQIGRLYQCGKGVPISLSTAKQWYEEAQKTADETAKTTKDIKPEVLTELNEHLNAVNQAIKNPNASPSSCPNTSTGDFYKTMLKM